MRSKHNNMAVLEEAAIEAVFLFAAGSGTKDPKASRRTFMAIASAYPDLVTDKDMAIALCSEWKHKKNRTPRVLAKERKKYEQHVRRINKAFKEAFLDAVQISRITAKGYKLIMSKRLRCLLQATAPDNIQLALQQLSDEFTQANHILRTAAQTLRTKKPLAPEWFRKQGPLACDFKNGTVFPRNKALSILQEKLREQQILFLIGGPASGKTVLVRNLAYNACEEDNGPVYFIDFDLERDLNPHDLAREAETLSGLVIIENAHVLPQKLATFLRHFRPSESVRLVLTAREHITQVVYRPHVSIDDYPQLQLDHEEGVEEIAEFLFDKLAPDCPPQHKTFMMDLAKESLWLFSYAIRGYKEHKGQGRAVNWAAKEIRAELEEIEKIRAVFPEIILSLSPLYMSELPTSEAFLTETIGYTKQDLRDLYVEGLITRQEMDGQFFYGLHHSGLAYLYWKHGKKYRSRRAPMEYRRYVRSYVLQEHLHPLAILICSLPTVKFLDSKGELASIIERETSTEAVIQFLRECHAENKLFDAAKCEDVLTKKITNCSCDKHIQQLIGYIAKKNEQAALSLCRTFGFDRLAAMVLNHKDMANLADQLEWLSHLGENIARTILDQIGMPWFLKKIRSCDDLPSISRCFQELNDACHDKAIELIQCLGYEYLSIRMNTSQDMYGITGCIGTICYVHQTPPLDFLRKLDFTHLGQLADDDENYDSALYMVTLLKHHRPDYTRTFIDNFHSRRLRTTATNILTAPVGSARDDWELSRKINPKDPDSRSYEHEQILPITLTMKL